MTLQNRSLRRFAAATLPFAPIGILLGWAGMRLAGGYGDEPFWTIAHLIWLPSYALLAIGFIALNRLTRATAESAHIPETAGADDAPGTAGTNHIPGPASRFVSGLALTTAVLGTIAVTAQMVIDLVLGFATSDEASMSDLSDRLQSVPGVELAVYEIGPALLFLGMLLITIHAAVRRTVPAYTAVLVVLGIAISVLEPIFGLPLRLPMVATIILFWFAARPITRALRHPELAATASQARNHATA